MSQNPFDFSDFRAGASGASTGAGEPAPVGRGPAPAGPGGYGPPARPGFPPGGYAAPAPGDGIAVSRPPLRLLGSALALAVLGGTLAGVAGATPWLALTGWVLAGPAAFATLGAFSTADTRQRARSAYAAPSWLRTGYWTTAVVAVLAVVVAAFRIAEWVGRL